MGNLRAAKHLSENHDVVRSIYTTLPNDPHNVYIVKHESPYKEVVFYVYIKIV